MDFIDATLVSLLIGLQLFLALRPKRMIFDGDNDITNIWWVRLIFLASAVNLGYSALKAAARG